jgi:sulfur-oxidizing protein SoxA
MIMRRGGMKRALILATAVAIPLVASVPAAIHGQQRNAIKPKDSGNPLAELISGYDFAPLNIRALQDDDFDNPGFAWVARGEALWSKPDGKAQKSCASCHGAAAETMRGKTTDYPKFYQPSGRIINLEQRINICRDGKMEAPLWTYGSDDMLGMTAYLRLQSRGVPVEARVDGPAKPVFEQGQAIYKGRMGQLGMSCAHCHDEAYGKTYGGKTISQGHGNGFPAFKVEKAGFSSLHEQFAGCFRLMKAEPHAPGSQDYVALELYLAWRGAGLPVETPAVRP